MGRFQKGGYFRDKIGGIYISFSGDGDYADKKRERRCLKCKTLLSQYNKNKKCYQCIRKEIANDKDINNTKSWRRV